MAVKGAPQVFPMNTPDTILGRSASFLDVDQGVRPGARRAMNSRMRFSSTISPGGSPSMTTPMASEWDCPKIVHLMFFPNSEDMGFPSQLPVIFKKGGVAFIHGFRSLHCNIALANESRHSHGHDDAMIVEPRYRISLQ